MIVRHSARSSALARSTEGEKVDWPLVVQLVHSIEHGVRTLLWAKTEDGRRGRNLPEPIPHPWAEKPKKLGGTAIPMDEMAALLGWELGSDNTT